MVLIFVVLALSVAGCGHDHHHHHGSDAGTIQRGETRRLSVVAETGVSSYYLEECESAYVVAIYHNGRYEPLGYNLTARVDGVVKQHDYNECKTTIEVSALPRADLGDYDIEVSFIFRFADGYHGQNSGFVGVEVIPGSARTPTPTPQPEPTPSPES